MIISIDIGSTWTKGAAFTFDNKALTLVHRASQPTTVHNLADGFFQVFQALLSQGNERLSDSDMPDTDIRLFYSSSAKGGLAVAALGIVPEITLESAKLVAWSAGAKLERVFSYQLTDADIRALEANPPDILLFAGGTDGGNTDYVVANARALAKSTVSCTMLYAGNRAVRDEVCELLSGHQLIAVDNLLPSLDNPNPGPAHEAIRAIFLSTIVKGKGLDTIIERTGVQPLPTPFAVYEFTKIIRQQVAGWEQFILLDMGGATTDVYSSYQPNPGPATVMRGLPEPEVKRSVEGDLGLRVSAASAAAAGNKKLHEALAQHGQSPKAFADYINKVVEQPDFLPEDQQGRLFDELLAAASISDACARHTGRMHQVYTTDGIVNVQVGRDLTQVRRVIGSGGYLSKVEHFNPGHWLARETVDAAGKRILLPAKSDYFRDEHYLIPLLANVAQGFPEAAAHFAINALAAPSLPNDPRHRQNNHHTPSLTETLADI